MATLNKEMVLATLLPEVTKNNIQQLINAGKKIKISRPTIKQNYEDLKRIREFYEMLKKRMEDENQPEKDNIATRKEAYAVYLKPMEEILDAAEPEFTRINYEIKKEEQEKFGGIKQQNEIMSRHIEFVNETAKMIALAADSKELARIQKLIGSEKSRTSFYGDYFPAISEVCDSMISLVDERKRIIKENDKLKKSYDTWLAAGDVAKAAEIKEQMEQNERVVIQNIEFISEKAYNHVSDIALLDTNFESESINPRLHRWSWKVADIELLFRKRPGLVSKEPNTKAINAFMKEQQETGTLNEMDDNEFDGLVLYRKPFFVAVKTTKDAS